MSSFRNIIWTYWTGDIPDILLTCKYSWKEHLTGWDIRWLNKDKLGKYNIPLPKNFDELPPAAQSDTIRLGLLYEYGGVWLDATIILNRDLNWLREIALIHPKDSYFAYQAYDADFIESWLLAVPKPKNPHILKFRNVLNDVLESWPEVESTKYYKNQTKYTKNDRYFMIYQSYCYLKHNDAKFKGAVVLSNSVQLAFIPIEIPFGLDPRYLIKFTSACRNRQMLSTLFFYVLLYTSVMLLLNNYLK
jgi:hypothetical protein